MNKTFMNKRLRDAAGDLQLPQLLDREADGSLIAHGNLKANTIAKQYRRRIVLPKKGIRSKAQITHTKDPEILVLLKLARGVTT